MSTLETLAHHRTTNPIIVEINVRLLVLSALETPTLLHQTLASKPTLGKSMRSEYFDHYLDKGKISQHPGRLIGPFQLIFTRFSLNIHVIS